MSIPPADPQRLLAQHAMTAHLLGVDFLPLGGPPPADTDALAPDADQQTTSKRATDFPQPTAATPPSRSTAPQDKVAQLQQLRDRHAQESPILTAIEGWTNIVFADGDPNAKVMFVGEAPGADEDAQGLPFVGRAGQLLNKMIVAMGLSRESVYIANVLKVRPPNNRTPTPAEWHMDGPYLKEQIRIVSPQAIVTLGKPAAAYLLDTNAAMGALRGSWHDFEGFPVMPTYHPAYLLRNYTPDARGKVWADLQQVMQRVG